MKKIMSINIVIKNKSLLNKINYINSYYKSFLISIELNNF